MTANPQNHYFFFNLAKVICYVNLSPLFLQLPVLVIPSQAEIHKIENRIKIIEFRKENLKLSILFSRFLILMKSHGSRIITYRKQGKALCSGNLRDDGEMWFASQAMPLICPFFPKDL